MIANTQSPQEVFTLWRYGLVGTEEAIQDIEDKIDNHDHKDFCKCHVWRSILRAMKSGSGVDELRNEISKEYVKEYGK